MHQIQFWYIDFGLPMSLGAVILVWDNPYVHRFWVAATPGASILARRSPRVY